MSYKDGSITYHFLLYILQGLEIDRLPSNKYVNDLLKRTEFNKLEGDGAFNEVHTNNLTWLHSFNPMLKLGYNDISKKCSTNNDKKCCRDVNYYLDLVIGYVKSSNLEDDNEEELIEYVNNEWKTIFQNRTLDDCNREENIESVRKRCVLKQLYDYCDDKNFIKNKETEYKELLRKKWGKIISYTISNDEDFYFNISGRNGKESFAYKDFLLDPEEFNCDNYETVLLSHISLSDKKLTNEVADGYESLPTPARGDTHQDHSPDTESGMKTEIEEPATSFMEPVLSAGLSLSGIVFFFFFMYKFSPIGSWLNSYMNKKYKMGRSTNKDETLALLHDFANNEHYISYHSISH
ncbi:PIR Superfamily Protein [Plasmodium ovale wallikeri]|uniref:PIR Superfamily Protein n=1 Tax=Plasmodium ovale wallikeri TaxID=864142 RepID=A0A1A9AK85_PLAOA|nr:PIR Superfamily Protein [Plasmodium ovale wallikeri]SBT56911.1 PIR Superfamily Protein [Plasmodium ovale wallikeri]